LEVCHEISQNKKCQFFHEISCSKNNMVYILKTVKLPEMLRNEDLRKANVRFAKFVIFVDHSNNLIKVTEQVYDNQEIIK
jgi:hypothetical protein